MVEELRRRTSNFFPTPESAMPPSFELFSLFQEKNQIGNLQSTQFTLIEPMSAITPNFATAPPYLEPNFALPVADLEPQLLSLGATVSPFGNWAQVPDMPPARPVNTRTSYSAPNIFSAPERNLDAELSEHFDYLRLDYNSCSSFRNPFSEDIHRGSLSSELPMLSQRLSIWSTSPERETQSGVQLPFGPLSHLDSLEVLLRSKNIYIKKLHTPVFVPKEEETAKNRSTSLEEAKLYSRINSERSFSHKASLEEKTELNTKVYLGKDTSEKKFIVNLRKTRSRQEPGSTKFGNAFPKRCSEMLLENLGVQDRPEDFCSTFYKRNSNGYMFIRESSNSLKVNSSGSKSWVTIRVKLGSHEPRKIKVDVKRLPEWKPINLNSSSASRKHRRDTRKRDKRDPGRISSS